MRRSRDRLRNALQRRSRAAAQLAGWHLGAGRRSRDRLARMQGRHEGGRCVILGNGPSLNHSDLDLLRDEVTFGLNRIYLKFEELGWETTYLACVNDHVLRQFAADFRNLDSTRFLAARSGARFKQSEELLLVPTIRNWGFACDPLPRGLNEGGTVTFVALQLAWWMGFREVVLVGVDHRFQTSGPAHKLVTASGDDPNHFHPDYFGTGTRWQLPDLEGSEFSYGLARREFEQDGRRIVDATVGGNLDVFPKAELGEVLAHD